MIDKLYIKKSVDSLREIAKEHKLKLVFRNATNNLGDFCFFIYSPKHEGYHTRYLVGFDGDWDANSNDIRAFDNCWKAAYYFIIEYNSIKNDHGKSI